MGCGAKEKDFKFWMPLEVKKGKDGEMRVGGIASDEDAEDLQGEKVFVDGLDVTYLLQRGAFNWDHKKDPGDILGEIDLAEKQGGKLYVEGFLYPGVPKAVETYNLMEGIKKSGSKRKLGLSLEGKVKERDMTTGKQIKKAWIKNVAITYNPINQGTWLDMIKSLGPFEFASCPNDCSKCALCEEVEKAQDKVIDARVETLDTEPVPSILPEQPSQGTSLGGICTECGKPTVNPESICDECRVRTGEVIEAGTNLPDVGTVEIVETEKAMSAGYDIPATSGGVSGSALRKEDLEKEVKVTTFGKKDFGLKKKKTFTKSELIDWLKENRYNGNENLSKKMAELVFEIVDFGKASVNICSTPGLKIGSKGKGKGLARGKGKGPIGVPVKKSIIESYFEQPGGITEVYNRLKAQAEAKTGGKVKGHLRTRKGRSEWVKPYTKLAGDDLKFRQTLEGAVKKWMSAKYDRGENRPFPAWLKQTDNKTYNKLVIGMGSVEEAPPGWRPSR